MKWLKLENNKLTVPPTFDKETGISNCHVNTEWLISHGYTQWTDERVDEFYNSQIIPPQQDEEESDTPVTKDDYDKAMEEHLLNERIARGYTLREPSDYKDDPYERFAQDAKDWIAHRSMVMVYGLQVQNDYEEGKEIPTLEEFKERLPKIEWTIK